MTIAFQFEICRSVIITLVAEPKGLNHNYRNLPLHIILSQFHSSQIITTYTPHATRNNL
jgi:hypothetical protein